MSKIKEAKMAMEDIIKAGREALDALEELMQIFPAAESTDGSKICPVDEVETKNPAPAATLEQVREIMAEKARTGYRAEVKALLTTHGAKQLSDITDPVELGVMMAEAEKIGG